MTSLPPALGSSFVMRNNESHCSGLRDRIRLGLGTRDRGGLGTRDRIRLGTSDRVRD